eukprot:scaffold1806_cov240-Pinguiococcus_pyrenoidosus.AAC.12
MIRHLETTAAVRNITARSRLSPHYLHPLQGSQALWPPALPRAFFDASGLQVGWTRRPGEHWKRGSWPLCAAMPSCPGDARSVESRCDGQTGQESRPDHLAGSKRLV